MQLSRRPLRVPYASFEASSCLFCQWRSFNFSYRRHAERDIPAKPPSPLDGAPRAYGKAVDNFTPKSLNRPIGLPKPPRSGENTGIDRRTFKERRDDFVDYDKHIVRRKQLYASFCPHPLTSYEARQRLTEQLERRRPPHLTFENGQICAITKESPSSRHRGYSDPTKPCISQICWGRPSLGNPNLEIRRQY